MLVDVPASNDPREALQRISQNVPQVRLPDLKPWGLTLRGARLVVVDGRPAAQLVYVAEDKALGAVTLVISAAKQPDLSRTIERRQDVNLLYWRNQGRALYPRWAGRYRLSLGHRQRYRLAAAGDLDHLPRLSSKMKAR